MKLLLISFLSIITYNCIIPFIENIFVTLQANFEVFKAKKSKEMTSIELDIEKMTGNGCPDCQPIGFQVPDMIEEEEEEDYDE